MLSARSMALYSAEGIGGKLSDGKKHDGRAPDYDDWSTVAENGKEGLNGDILIWYPVSGPQLRAQFYGYPCRQGEPAASA